MTRTLKLLGTGYEKENNEIYKSVISFFYFIYQLKIELTLMFKT